MKQKESYMQSTVKTDTSCPRKRRAQAGFSIMEVLISLAMMSVVTMAIFKAYITQHENYIAQEDITEIQQGARASLDEITRQVRMAGFGLPVGLPAIVASNTNPDTITVNYQTSDCDTWLLNDMAAANNPIQCGSSISCFNSGSLIYIFAPDSGGGEWFTISGVDTTARTISHAGAPLTRKYLKDDNVLEMYQVKFYLDNKTEPEHPKLMAALPGQAPYVYAENVTDLQFTYRLANGLVVDVPPLLEDVREVLIAVTARSDRAKASDGQYRTRTYNTSASLRNL